MINPPSYIVPKLVRKPKVSSQYMVGDFIVIVVMKLVQNRKFHHNISSIFFSRGVSSDAGFFINLRIWRRDIAK